MHACAMDACFLLHRKVHDTRPFIACACVCLHHVLLYDRHSACAHQLHVKRNVCIRNRTPACRHGCTRAFGSVGRRHAWMMLAQYSHPSRVKSARRSIIMAFFFLAIFLFPCSCMVVGVVVGWWWRVGAVCVGAAAFAPVRSNGSSDERPN
jgi:nitrate reductase NapE component